MKVLCLFDPSINPAFLQRWTFLLFILPHLISSFAPIKITTAYQWMQIQVVITTTSLVMWFDAHALQNRSNVVTFTSQTSTSSLCRYNVSGLSCECQRWREIWRIVVGACLTLQEQTFIWLCCAQSSNSILTYPLFLDTLSLFDLTGTQEQQQQTISVKEECKRTNICLKGSFFYDNYVWKAWKKCLQLHGSLKAVQSHPSFESSIIV